MLFQTLNNIKGYVSAVVALVSCPCHLPITLPLFFGLTAGTALGGWLSTGHNTLLFVLLVGGGLTVIFIGSTAMAFRWMVKPTPARTDATPHRRQKITST